MKKLLLIFFLGCVGQIAHSQTDVDSITVHNILIEGNVKTKPQIITRELSYKIGDTYLRSELDSMFVWDGHRIYNTNLFNKVDFDIVNESDGQADIKITIDERWYLYPIPIFRLVDRNFNDWWVNRNRDLRRVNYGLRITQYNFRGRAERLRIIAQSGFETKISFNYHIPYIEKTQRHGLNLSFSYQENKRLAYTTDNNIRTFASNDDELLRKRFRNNITHIYRSSFFSYHFTSFGNLNVHVADTVTQLNENYLMNGTKSQKYFFLGYYYHWDRRNNRSYPTIGEWYRIGFTKFGLGLNNDGIDYWVINTKLTKYLELGKKWYYAGSVTGLVSFPAEQDYANYFLVGFLDRIRGHNLNIIEGNIYGLQLNEVKYKLFSRVYNIRKVMPIKKFQMFPITIFGKVFYDHGYVNGYPNYMGSDLLDDRYIYSYGAGIDLVLLYDRVFRFELSRNTLNQTNFFINILSFF